MLESGPEGPHQVGADAVQQFPEALAAKPQVGAWHAHLEKSHSDMKPRVLVLHPIKAQEWGWGEKRPVSLKKHSDLCAFSRVQRCLHTHVTQTYT
jgi:hypothetical protein